MRSSATRLLFVCLVLAAAFSVSAQSSDPFALTTPLVSQAITSCGDVTVSSGLVDSSATAGRGNVLSNGNIKVSGGKVDGGAIAGPGKSVTRSGSGVITGGIGSATSAFPCSIVDLSALATTLASANDNGTIPLSAQHKNPVSSAGDFTLSGGDSLTLQPGTYYFHKFTMSGGSHLTVAGPVHILTTSDVNVTGGSVAGANQWQLRFWSSATKFVVSSSTFGGFIYAPSAVLTVSSGTVTGGIYGGTVTVSGSSHVTRTIDNTPPVVTIISPVDHEAVIDLSQVPVRGIVTDPESAITSFQLNGANVPLASDGSFTVTLNLSTATPPAIAATASNAAGLTSTSTVTVQSSLTQLTIVPSVLSIDQNAAGQLAAIGTYAGGSTADVTASATWSSSAPSIATVNTGTVSGASAGTATVTATLGSLSASATVTVRPLLQSITVAPAIATIALGGRQAFTATGNYSDGSTKNLSSSVIWSTSDPALASIDATGMTTALSAGTVIVRASAGSITGSATLTVTTSIVAFEISGPATTFTAGDSVPFNALARLSDGSSIDVSKQASWSIADANVANVDTNGMVTGSAAGTTSLTATYKTFSASVQVQVSPLQTVVVSAPPIDRTVVQPLNEIIKFLYSGANPIQTGVTPNTIQERRVATIRGTVHDRAGHPIAGVAVTVVNHPEYGRTVTRADGVFDLVLNGGGAVTLALRKAGYIEAQRLVATQWNDQQVIDGIVMIGFDASVSAVTMGFANDQVARGGSMSDADGARQATLIVPAGEAATITAADGTTTSATTLHVRATEFTVGASGPAAMPATLPPSSGYTYCVELSADEANGGTVQFTKPLAFYVENFLNFPVGTAVPLGYYDRTAVGWRASANGRVIKILAITNGQAVLDTNGDGTADDSSTLAALGIDSAEVTALASTYTAGQSLWRCPIAHFTPWDGNFPILTPPDAVHPNQPQPQWIPAPATSCQVCEANRENASTVNMADQVYRESIPIQGTPYSLDYDSSIAGRTQYKTVIHLTGPTIPASLLRVDLKISVAGADT
ncbi:MAG TPA: Ig-like domain-containing protein, partial [Vicinamibacterales bacterium]